MIGLNDEDQVIDGGDPGGQDESEKTISLMGGVVRPEGLPEADLELQSMKGPSKFLGHGTLLLVIVFVIAVGSLWAMRVGQGDLRSSTQAKAVEAKVEQALAKLSKPAAMAKDDPLRPKNLQALLNDTDEIVAMFAADPTRHQVPIENVKKNPFVIHRPKPKEAEQEEHARPKPPKEDPIKLLKNELAKYEVQSIVQGARPVAIINGDFLQPGQTLGSFKVTEIRDLVVVLEAEGHTFTLEMKEDPNAPTRRRRR